MDHFMFFEAFFTCKSFATILTVVWPHTTVYYFMACEFPARVERLVTHFTSICLLIVVIQLMVHQTWQQCVPMPTNLTHKWLLGAVYGFVILDVAS